MTKKKSWLKKNRDVVLFVLGVMIAVGISYYSGAQYASGVLALAHQNSALHNGVNSDVVKLPNGFLGNSDSANFKVTMNYKASIEVFIRCNDGTTFNGTGPFACPTT